MREITITGGEYDRTAAFITGTLALDGTPYRYRVVPFERDGALRDEAEGDVREVSFAAYCTTRAEGDDRFVGLPIFPARAFQHGSLYVREGSEFDDPAQLKGARVGIEGCATPTAVWVRGFLQDNYGIAIHDVEWVSVPVHNGVESAADGPEAPARELHQCLERGEIDAAITPTIPQPATVRRLFRDHRDIEEAYFKRTRIFPILSIVVIRREVYVELPWLARSLCKAYWQAKKIAQEHMYRTNALPYTLPWMIPLIERTEEIMGKDPWAYGLPENEATLSAFMRHLHDQEMTSSLLKQEDLVVASQWTNSRQR